ncbi:DNL zinc finger-domain-containing protein [Daldinia eschscholtzii]|nr:DNL zinc finger-domain-containing protein [Daldinia eschscholtzii]
MASTSTSRLLFSKLLRSSKPTSRSVRPFLPQNLQPTACRFAHAIPRPTPSTSSSSSEQKPRKLLEPHYELTFTCVPCGDRSTHTVSKQGYHKGSVLITCPACRNRHVISDHLNIFGNRKVTIEDIMREKGQLVKRGTLGETGDVEFWEDGSVTKRGTAAAGSTSDLAQDELSASEEQEEASLSREARDPSSQSTNPTPATSAPLANSGARPSVDSTQRTDQVPSTRRQ